MTSHSENHQQIIKISNEDYSEWVIRHSLYWISSKTQWTVSKNKESWKITLQSSNTETTSELYRLLNDYKLREIIQSQSGSASELTSIVISQIKKNETTTF